MNRQSHSLIRRFFAYALNDGREAYVQKVLTCNKWNTIMKKIYSSNALLTNKEALLKRRAVWFYLKSKNEND
jgi:hypothetical protein